LTVYLFAFIKVLPSFNKIVIETQSYIYTKLFVKKINHQLKNYIVTEKSSDKILDFNNSIEVKNISYKWEEVENMLFENLNLIITKDSKTGIIGKSGSGKTTFLNILMGFVIPNKGEILVDNKNIKKDLFEWRKKIAYVSQSNYMLDESLLKNITFQSDINNIDKELLNHAIYYSGLNELIKNAPLGINTLVGERGSKISGGEILRIALARAYYSKKEIFILDEFTSALDNETENKILDNLDIQKKTIIMVSHKKSALKNCDRIYELTTKGFLFL
jgi:ABC-type bacteriocin/lantibiotic exporter with double-glycine peptidase domain